MPKLVRRYSIDDLLNHNKSVCNPSFFLEDQVIVYRDGRKEKEDDNTKLLKIGHIDQNLNITNCRTISIPNKDLSDPRLVKWKNKVYVVITQIILRIQENKGYLARMDLLDPETNQLLGITYDQAEEREKNWIFFEYNNELFCSRSLWDGKHQVLKLSSDTMQMIDYSVSNYTTNWNIARLGDIRNTSNFFFYNGLMWGCLHSHDQHLYSPATYFCGIFAFEPEPPFKIVKMSNVPLFSGRFRGDIIYPNHLDILSNGTFRIGMGVFELDHFDIITLSPQEIFNHLEYDLTFTYI